eukprot:gnl/TRDRNA2_/TRDRNA2_134015_c0_seq1.p1 gnl/TRDRNA2_/TRDRNA2_134015_c0~~gnl/TRDRNA2_/TRDRNA2_134015_c0_seq1.p1  ORF type:complete len:589 (+),score=142.77 gnl/TRDRNA2_/TRDRNA2_134015_c0_seq1:167-1933(+)
MSTKATGTQCMERCLGGTAHNAADAEESKLTKAIERERRAQSAAEREVADINGVLAMRAREMHVLDQNEATCRELDVQVEIALSRAEELRQQGAQLRASFAAEVVEEGQKVRAECEQAQALREQKAAEQLEVDRQKVRELQEQQVVTAAELQERQQARQQLEQELEVCRARTVEASARAEQLEQENCRLSAGIPGLEEQLMVLRRRAQECAWLRAAKCGLESKVALDTEPRLGHENEICVTFDGKMSAYVARATKIFVEMGSPKLLVTATGKMISKAVALAEVLKHRFKGLHQISSILNSGLSMQITLSTDPLDESAPGYQAPIREDLVVETYPVDDVDHETADDYPPKEALPAPEHWWPANSSRQRVTACEVTYPNGACIDVSALSCSTAAAGPSGRSGWQGLRTKLVEATESGLIAQTAVETWTAWHAAGFVSSARLGWNNGEVQKFVRGVFVRHGLNPPPERELMEAFRLLDVGCSGSLGVRECPVLVDVLFRAALQSHAAAGDGEGEEEIEAVEALVRQREAELGQLRAMLTRKANPRARTLPKPQLLQSTGQPRQTHAAGQRGSAAAAGAKQHDNETRTKNGT